MIRKALVTACLSVITVFVLSGCASERNNIAYRPDFTGVKKLARPVTGVIVPIADMREKTRAYPKQVIMQTSYGGEITYDINDRTVSEVVTDALSTELAAMGVNLVKSGIEGPLDKDTAQSIRQKLAKERPDVQVAIGGKVSDFLATSKKGAVTTRVYVTAGMQLYTLDVKTGDLIWSEYKTDWEDSVMSADHNYMIKQLDKALEELMKKGVRENKSLREDLTRISGQ